MKQLLAIFFLVLSMSVQASSAGTRLLGDSITSSLEQLKSILHSGEWQASDSLTFVRIDELIEYLENAPIDSVIVDLEDQIDTVAQFLKRDLSFIENPQEIEGYIDAYQINNTMVNIEKRVVQEMPLESIMVPQNMFVGMYSKLPLILAGDAERLLLDSLVILPDTLVTFMETHHTRRTKSKADSLKALFLEKARKAYNDSLIQEYQDSVSQAYRLEYRNNFIEELKQAYVDSASNVNYQLLTVYNDSVSQVFNEDFRNLLQSVITRVNRIPNEITVYNLFGEEFSLPLQNDNIWYRWLWLKNALNDSIGIRVINLDRHTVRFLLDENVNLSRLTKKETMAVMRVEPSESLNQNLSKINNRTLEKNPWSLVGKAYSGFTQTYINDFWHKGGKSSASALATFSYDANYSKEKLKWENGLDTKLGLINYIEDDPDVIRNWLKNSDNFEINSRLGYSAFKEWYYSAEANFRTQFFRGYKNNKTEEVSSALFSPAYFTLSAGFDYKPNKFFSTFVSPLSVKTTFVTNSEVDKAKYSISEDQNRKSLIGMTGRVNFQKEIFENVNIRTKNNLFFNLGMKDGEWQFFRIPDFDTETLIDFKVNHYITTQVNIHLRYDKELESKWEDENGLEQSGARLQVKEFFTLGLSYRF